MVSSLHSFTIFLLILSTSSSIPPSAYSMGGFSIDLLYRDSQKLHLLTSNSTSSSILKATVERSFARANYFYDSIQNINSSSASSSLLSTDHNIFSQIFSLGSNHFIELYIGSQGTKTLAIADTGSNLIWVKCYPQNAPLFNPRASSTYKNISCHADSCSNNLKIDCGPESQCLFNCKYGDKLSVQGLLATDTFSFNSNGKHRVPIPSIIFGCTHQINDPFNENITAIVGLGGGQNSLIRQLGSSIKSMFSYCLTSHDNPSYTSRLNFGSNAVVSGRNSATMPLFINNQNSLYFLSLEKISVEGQGYVNVKSANMGTKGNIIIDSGTTLTFIDNETMQSVERKILKSVKSFKVVDPSGIFNLCFKPFKVMLPHLTFHFSNGAEVVLPKNNVYIRSNFETVCLTIESSHKIGFNIFGNLAQQNLHIGYDLSAMKLTIAPADCAKM